ncbi:MAG: hypothetical protein VKP63_04595 [Cyanobacteriota bacterium]|nr:hypothetical protein [Cyanobacteriota bacterium]
MPSPWIALCGSSLTISAAALTLPSLRLAASAAEPPGAVPPPQAAPWRATVELYGFAPLRTTGTATVRGFETEVDTSLSTLIPLIETAGFVRGSVEQGRFGVLTDLSYVQIGDQITRTGPRGLLTGRVDQTSIQGVYDIAFRYRLGAEETAVGTPGALSVIPYAGIRLVKSQLDLAAVIEGTGPLRLRLQKEGSWQRTWTQPLLGTQASLFLTPGLRAFARADIGGLGLAGEEDLSGNAQVGLGLALGANTQLDLSWRYFGLRYNNGAERETGLNTRQNGIEVGLKLFF